MSLSMQMNLIKQNGMLRCSLFTVSHLTVNPLRVLGLLQVELSVSGVTRPRASLPRTATTEPRCLVRFSAIFSRTLSPVAPFMQRARQRSEERKYFPIFSIESLQLQLLSILSRQRLHLPLLLQPLSLHFKPLSLHFKPHHLHLQPKNSQPGLTKQQTSQSHISYFL